MQKKDSGKGNYYGKYDDGINRSNQESEGRADRKVLTMLEGDSISEKALVIDGKIAWESRKNGYFHKHAEEVKNITESGVTSIENEKSIL